MAQRNAGFLVFEDTTYGSFSASFTVPGAGFRWAEDDELEPLPGAGRTPRGPWLVARDPVDGGPWGHRSSPFQKGKHANLVGPFADLATPDDFRRFADRHGFLGHPVPLAPAAGGAGVLGEPLAFWERHVRQVRVLTKLAAWASKGDAGKLGSVVFWAREPERVVVWPGAVLDRMEAEASGGTYVPVEADETRPVAIEGPDGVRAPDDLPWFWRLGPTVIRDPGVLRDARGHPRWRFGDVLGPARFYVCEALNREIKGHVHPKVLPFVGDPGLWRLYLVPDCVLSVVYLQLQLILTKGAVGHDAKRCAREGCANVVLPSGNARYCSDPCRRWGRSQSNKRHHRSRTGRAPTARALGGRESSPGEDQRQRTPPDDRG
ncbi:MAG: hypothetical protein M3Q10_10815 [Chloroflexota bacterium]|nr:hypothetical protein [Chloroflexota bacterium]